MLAPHRPLNRPLGLFRDVLALRKDGQTVPEGLETYVRDVLEDALRIAGNDRDFQLKHFESIRLASELKRSPELLELDFHNMTLPEVAAVLETLLDGIR